MSGPSLAEKPHGQRGPEEAALLEALAACATSGRLSDAQVHAMRAKRRRTLAAGAASIVLAVGGGVWFGEQARVQPVALAHFETRRGEQRSFRLRDGSTVRLSGATTLDVRFEADRRGAVLRRGEAYFDIAHDPARPFAVAAGKSDTRVLGTAFDVDLASGGVKLAVYRGRVRFGPATSQRDGDTVVVPAGWRSQFRGGAAGAPTRFDSAQQDWRDGWLDTDAMRLGDVVETLNRGGGPLIAPPPPALADLPLSGRFKLDEPRQLLEAVGEVYGFQVRDDGKQLHLQAK
uniref:FecR family protein n=1 Tax=uncultured Sphingomonas sp. TaxID=158754 RepID=UPI0035C9FFA7